MNKKFILLTGVAMLTLSAATARAEYCRYDIDTDWGNPKFTSSRYYNVVKGCFTDSSYTTLSSSDVYTLDLSTTDYSYNISQDGNFTFTSNSGNAEFSFTPASNNNYTLTNKTTGETYTSANTPISMITIVDTWSEDGIINSHQEYASYTDGSGYGYKDVLNESNNSWYRTHDEVTNSGGDGYKKDFAYDSSGNQYITYDEVTIDGGNYKTSYTYDENWNKTSFSKERSDPLGFEKQDAIYNDKGQSFLTHQEYITSDGQSGKIDHVYDENWNQYTTYDELKNPDGTGHTVAHSYDANWNQHTTYDELKNPDGTGHTVAHSYDANWNQYTTYDEAIYPNGETYKASYTYDNNWNRIQSHEEGTNSDGRTYKNDFIYDEKWGRLITHEEVTKTDGSGYNADYIYDDDWKQHVLHREETHSDGFYRKEDYSYDDDWNPTQGHLEKGYGDEQYVKTDCIYDPKGTCQPTHIEDVNPDNYTKADFIYDEKWEQHPTHMESGLTDGSASNKVDLIYDENWKAYIAHEEETAPDGSGYNNDYIYDDDWKQHLTHGEFRKENGYKSIEDQVFGDDFELLSRTFKAYLNEQLVYERYGSLDSDGLWHSEEKEYDEDGRLIRKSNSAENPDGSSTYTEEIYDKDGNLSTKLIENCDRRCENTLYDAQGNILKVNGNRVTENCVEATSKGVCTKCSGGYLEKDRTCISANTGCGENYRQIEDWCNRIRYTPAEAAEAMNGDDNTITLTFKK